jgi:hypothetical protein
MPLPRSNPRRALALAGRLLRGLDFPFGKPCFLNYPHRKKMMYNQYIKKA